jgi:hypothetical protein
VNLTDPNELPVRIRLVPSRGAKRAAKGPWRPWTFAAGWTRRWLKRRARASKLWALRTLDSVTLGPERRATAKGIADRRRKLDATLDLGRKRPAPPARTKVAPAAQKRGATWGSGGVAAAREGPWSRPTAGPVRVDADACCPACNGPVTNAEPVDRGGDEWERPDLGDGRSTGDEWAETGLCAGCIECGVDPADYGLDPAPTEASPDEYERGFQPAPYEESR